MRILTYWEGCSIWVGGNNLEDLTAAGTPNPAWMEGGEVWQHVATNFMPSVQEMQPTAASPWYLLLVRGT